MDRVEKVEKIARATLNMAQMNGIILGKMLQYFQTMVGDCEQTLLAIAESIGMDIDAIMEDWMEEEEKRQEN